MNGGIDLQNSYVFILFAFMTSQSLARPISPRAVYGEDSRIEWYQSENPTVQKAALSAVAIVANKNLNVKPSGSVELLLREYGPDNNLCHEERFYTQGTLSDCSGVLFGADLVLTAGHCIQNEKQCRAKSFVIGWQLDRRGNEPLELPPENIFNCSKIVVRKNLKSGVDFALVQLDRPVKNFAPAQMRRDDNVSEARNLFVAGYPMGLPMKIASGFVRKNRKYFLETNLDTYSGNSGSPVFDLQSGLLEGILIEGEEDFDYIKDRQCQVTRRCENHSCQGEDVLKISEILNHIDLYIYKNK